MIDQTILQNTGLKMVLTKCMTEVDHLLILKNKFYMYLHNYLAVKNRIKCGSPENKATDNYK